MQAEGQGFESPKLHLANHVIPSRLARLRAIRVPERPDLPSAFAVRPGQTVKRRCRAVISGQAAEQFGIISRNGLGGVLPRRRGPSDIYRVRAKLCPIFDHFVEP